MSNKASFLLLCFMVFSSVIKAEWVPLDNSKVQNSPPKVTLLSDDRNSTVIKVDITGFDLKEFQSGGKTFHSIDLLSESMTADPGDPELPYIARILAIPDNAAVSIEVLEAGTVRVFSDINLAPVRESWIEGTPEPAYADYKDIYRDGYNYPAKWASMDQPAVFRDFRISRVSIYPVQYNPSKKELQVVSSLTVRIIYGNGPVVNPRTASDKAISPSFGKIYRSSIFNYQEVLDDRYGGREDGREMLLCIMPDEFYNSFQVYAEWKRQSGMEVQVTIFSDIPGNPNNPDVIKAYITQAYHDWEDPPTYVLIVGDDGVFPKKIVTYPDYSFPNEDFFVEIDGDDYFPEMMIGRFTNQQDYRMQVMINKFMLYEKSPDTTAIDWFKHGTVCSNNAYESQRQTKRFTANQMLQYGGFNAVDTLMSDGWGWDCSVDLEDVLDAINSGRSFLNYRGEGWVDGWQASCYYFSTSDVSGLSNGQKFTFVTSIGCGVAMFDAWGVNNCFGEEWVELGSLTAPRGGVAFVGPTSNTHTTYNNKIDMGIYTGMFSEGMDTPGEALLRGKLYMYNVFGNEYYVEYHYKIYCVLGDPSIHIWKEVPLAINVDHPVSILVGPQQVEVTVNFASTGQPAVNAQVTLTGEEIFATGICDEEGHVVLDIAAEQAEFLTLTVRGGDVYPYQGQIEVVQPAELVMPENDPVIVDLDGNLDGLANPNENCSMTFTLRNWGSQTANNVTATLQTSAPEFLQINTTSPISFGNMASGATISGDPFQVYFAPECQVGQVIPLQLHVNSNNNSWDYFYNVTVNGCSLSEFKFMVNDEGSANQNYRMDPGETVMLFVSVINQGNDAAPDVVGILSSDDPYITIIDSMGSYGTIGISSTALNSVNYFIVSVDPGCPTNYLAEYSLKLRTYNGNYPYSTNSSFVIPVSKPISSDYTGPDAYGYYAYSSDDYFDQSPEYSWFEIRDVGTQMVISDIGDFTITVNLPFTFKYYGVSYYQLRISTDGWIAPGNGTQTSSQNTSLPHIDNINCMAAGFWDDLYDFETVEGNIYYYFDLENHRFIVEWDSIARNDFGSEPSVEIFQAVLYDPDYYPTLTDDGEIVFYYKNVENPQFCTVGIENHTQDVGLQWVYNNNYDPTASALMNEFAVKFTTEPPFASIITDIDDDILSPSGYELMQNRPNPFRTNTWISYFIPEPCQVSLVIYNIQGEVVRTLNEGKCQSGTYTVEWNGSNDSGVRVSAGIYFYQLRTGNFKETRKMFILQ